MSFIDELVKNLTLKTENGALMYASSGNPLLDMNFKVTSYRSSDSDEIIRDFMMSFVKYPEYSLKWLFYLRDVRGGAGEKRTFEIIFNYLLNEAPEYFANYLYLIPEYGSWKDIITLFNLNRKENTKITRSIILLLKDQLKKDLIAFKANEPISLLAKWMPSENTSNKESRQMARLIMNSFNFSPKQYRKMLSALRARLGDAVVERKISARKWDKVIYEDVCSKANLNLNPAFLKHDEKRRREFLEKAVKGEVKLNSSTLYPYEIFHRYSDEPFYSKLNNNLEAAWKNLPNYVKDDSSTLVVADGSASMLDRISEKTNITNLSVASSLAIYFAERAKGDFKNTFITFSENPQLIRLPDTTLLAKIKEISKHEEISNTNIVKVFKLILKTAVTNHMSQEELPKRILIISDMEFDRGASFNQPLFEEIKKAFKYYGYSLPELVFWNVGSRTKGIPVQENKNGFKLVSGFGASTCEMVLSNEVDPFLALKKILDSERYSQIAI